MTAKTMADIITAHLDLTGDEYDLRYIAAVRRLANDVEQELTAAGFGLVKTVAEMAAIERKAMAWALRDAAGDLDLPGTEATGYYSSGDAAGYAEAERHAEAWLRARAATIEASHDV
jgi:hypothetical protein